MSQLALQLDPTIKSMYLRLADGIRKAISNGQLMPCEKLPSARELANSFQINRHTVMAAYHELIAQGWLESIERKHYQVAQRLPIETSKTATSPSLKDRRFQWPIRPALDIDSPTKPATEYQINLAGGMPDINLFPFKEFKGYMSQSLLNAKVQHLGYGNNQGTSQFIEQVQTYLRRVRSITDKQVIAVNGTQEALFLLAQVLIKPGDQIAVESLGYQPAWDAFKTAGAKLVGIKQHRKGIDVTHLKEMIIKGNIKMIYLTPLHQYPTTVTMPIEERMEIYALAVKYGIIIVEDDYDHEFHYDSQPLAPMAANDPSGQVIYLATFSKIMFPGCRIGCMAVDPSLVPALLKYRSIINHKTNTLLQDAIALWMKDGAFERHLRRMTKTYRQRRENLVELLSDYQQQGFDLDYYIPAGGMALWLDIKENASELEEYCLQQDIYIQTEGRFHLERKNDQNRFIRLGFAGISSEKLANGLTTIFDFLSQR